ncbi:MAG: thiamine-phosphate diphosphorylase [Candidatus Pelagibacter sp. TMED128]|nr:MAG: thiamine-phosphate diphosphorylase [Candidatus Pelagibacter sp. TMED128]
MKKIVYLISPNDIQNKFYEDLIKVLSAKNVGFFQLRLKKVKKDKLIKIAKKIKKITNKYKVKLIINDYPDISKTINADGCHLGQNDTSLINAKKYLKKKIIGVTCHNSKLLAKIAIKNKADYLAFGSFNNSKLKPKAKKANLNILKWARRNIKKPIVAIGGINNLNYKKLIKSGAKYIAISSYIWDNPKLKPEIAIRKFK